MGAISTDKKQMSEKISGCICALEAVLKTCNASKDDKGVNAARLQTFDLLNEMIIELPTIEDYVFTKFHEFFEEYFAKAIDGKWSCHLFSPAIRSIFGKCVEQIYCVHKANAVNFIRKCLKVINSRYNEYVKVECMEVLSILLDQQCEEISIFIPDCYVYCSKFMKISSEEEMIGCLHFLGSVLRNYSLAVDSDVFPKYIPVIYKQLQKALRYEASVEIRCAVPELLYEVCIVCIEFVIPGYSIALIVNDLFGLFTNKEIAIRSYACRYCAILFAELISRSQDRKYLKNRSIVMKEGNTAEAMDDKKTTKEEGNEYNPVDYTFESVIRIFITKMNSVSEVQQLLCYAQTIMCMIFSARDLLLERDVTILVNVLFEFLRLHPIPAVKASVEHIISRGICQYLSESHITISSSIVNRYISSYSNNADLPTEIVAITAAQLLARIIPILGEAIKSQLDEFLSSLLPTLTKDSAALQTTIIKSLILMGSTDAGMIEVMIKQIVLKMNEYLEIIENEKDEEKRMEILQCDNITGFCKALGELLMLLYTKKHDISFDLLNMLYEKANFLNDLYEKNTIPDTLVNSVTTASAAVLHKRCIYQYCKEGFWYIMQGLLLMDNDWLLPEIEIILKRMEKEIISVCTVFHSILYTLHNKVVDIATLQEEIELNLQLMVPCLQSVLCVLRIRRDLFDKYTPIFNGLIQQFQTVCLSLNNLSSLITSSNYILLQRLILLSLHIISSFPSSALIAGCDYYLPLTMLSVVQNQAESSLSEELLSKEDDVLLMKNKPDCIVSLEEFEKASKVVKNRNEYDYEDETFYFVLYKALTTPSANPPYPALLLPQAPLISVRLENAAIQCFSQLFVYSGSGGRGRMMEVVLNSMSKVENRSLEDRRIIARNICSILWSVANMSVKYDIYLEPHPWLQAACDVLLSALSSNDCVNRRMAAETLSQLCVVVDIEFVTALINQIQIVLSNHTDENRVSGCIYCLCCIQRSIDTHNGDALNSNIIRILIAECSYYTQPIRGWCLHSVAVYLQHNDVIRDNMIIKWILMTINSNMLQDAGGIDYAERTCVELSILHIINTFLDQLDNKLLSLYKYSFVSLLNIIDYIWNTCNDSQVLQSCLSIYSILFELCPQFLHIPAITDRIRRSMICNDKDLRFSSIICMKRIISTTPNFIYGKKDEIIIDIKSLLEEVLTCYQKCVLSDESVSINACSELYIDIINKKIASMNNSIEAMWMLIRDISKVVMGDAPLLDIFSVNWNKYQDVKSSKVDDDDKDINEDQGNEALTNANTQEADKEWMWQASLLSLEGSYTVIKKLFEMVDEKNKYIYRVLSELIRLCCHSTTISYEGSQLECIQTLGLCILNDVIIHYASIPDTEDKSHYYIEQYEIQIVAAIRRALTLSCIYDPVVLSVNIVFVLITKGIITDTTTLSKLMQMVKPIDEDISGNKTLLKIEEIKVKTMAQLCMLYYDGSECVSESIKKSIVMCIRQDREYWRAKWCIRIRREMDQLEKKENSIYLVAAASLLDAELIKKEKYGMEQYILIMGATMTAINTILSKSKGVNEITKEERVTLCHCLSSLHFASTYLDCLTSASMGEDFITYCISSLFHVLSMPVTDVMLYKKIVDVYNDVMMRITKMGITMELTARKEEYVCKETMGSIIDVLVDTEAVDYDKLSKPVWMKEEVKIIPDNAATEIKVSIPSSAIKKEDDSKKESDSEYSYESYYSYVTDSEGNEEGAEAEMEIRAPKSDVAPSALEEVKKAVPVSDEVIVKDTEAEEKKDVVVRVPRSGPTALALMETKLEKDDHLFDSDNSNDEEAKKPIRRGRNGAKKEGIVKDPGDGVDLEPKEASEINHDTVIKVTTPEVVPVQIEEVKEAVPVSNEVIVKDTEAEEKKDVVVRAPRSGPTALALMETKLEKDDHLFDSDNSNDEEAKKPTRRGRGRKVNHEDKRPIIVQDESPLGCPAWSDDDDEIKPRRVRKAAKSSTLSSFEADFDKEATEVVEAVEEAAVEETVVEETVEETVVEETVEEAVIEETAKETVVEEAIKKEETKETKEEDFSFSDNEKDEKGEDFSFSDDEVREPPVKEQPDIPAPDYSALFTTDPFASVPLTQAILEKPSSSTISLHLLQVTDLLINQSMDYSLLQQPLLLCVEYYRQNDAIMAYFVKKFLTILSTKRITKEEVNCLVLLITTITKKDIVIRKCIMDKCVDFLITEQQDKSKPVQCSSQVMTLVNCLYLGEKEEWSLMSLIGIYGNAFSKKIQWEKEELIISYLQFYMSSFVECVTKTSIEHARFLLAVLSLNIIVTMVPFLSSAPKAVLLPFVQFTILLYAKTEKKNEIVSIIVVLCVQLLKRNQQMQPLVVSKLKEDSEIVMMNQMIGEVLFMMVKMNPDEFKKSVQGLNEEDSTLLQAAVKRTVQMKQNESNAARRRNAARMPIKLDASKFEM